MSRNKRNKAGKGPAFQPKGNLVVQARAELNRTVLALRHSNAIAAYLLSLVDGSVRIPKKLYVELLADDNTTMKWAEDGDDMVITMPVKPIKVDYAEVERRAAAHMVANATPEERMAVKNKLTGALYGQTTHLEPATPESTIGHVVPGLTVKDTVINVPFVQEDKTVLKP